MDGWEPYDVEFTVPTDGAHFGNSSVRRLGLTDADLAFRERLYPIVGRATVARGRIEASMKRILLFLNKDLPKYTLVDETWSGLEKKLKNSGR